MEKICGLVLVNCLLCVCFVSGLIRPNSVLENLEGKRILIFQEYCVINEPRGTILNNPEVVKPQPQQDIASKISVFSNSKPKDFYNVFEGLWSKLEGLQSFKKKVGVVLPDGNFISQLSKNGKKDYDYMKENSISFLLRKNYVGKKRNKENKFAFGAYAFSMVDFCFSNLFVNASKDVPTCSVEKFDTGLGLITDLRTLKQNANSILSTLSSCYFPKENFHSVLFYKKLVSNLCSDKLKKPLSGLSNKWYKLLCKLNKLLLKVKKKNEADSMVSWLYYHKDKIKASDYNGLAIFIETGSCLKAILNGLQNRNQDVQIVFINDIPVSTNLVSVLSKYGFYEFGKCKKIKNAIHVGGVDLNIGSKDSLKNFLTPELAFDLTKYKGFRATDSYLFKEVLNRCLDRCNFCEKPKKYSCSVCRCPYCSSKCQKQDWSNHKKYCCNNEETKNLGMNKNKKGL
jgi:hypothetical protein